MSNARITNPTGTLTYPQKVYANRLGIGENLPFGKWTMTQGEFQTKLDAYYAKPKAKVVAKKATVVDNRTLAPKAEPVSSFALVLKNEIKGLELRLSKRIKHEVAEQINALVR
jgi:hypothetical protein